MEVAEEWDLYILVSHPSCLREGHSLKGGVGVGGTGIRGFDVSIVGAGEFCDCGICFDSGPSIFLLMLALPYHFLGWNGENIILGWGADLGSHMVQVGEFILL